MSSRAAMQAAFLLVCMASPASCFTQMTNQLQRCKLLASISTRPVCPGRCWRASLDSAGRGSRDRADDPYDRLLRERSIGRAFTTKTWLSLPRVFVLLRAGTSGMKIHCQEKEDGVHDFGYGYPAPVFVDSIVVFESRADAENYAQRLRNQTCMVFEVEPVEPRRVLLFAARSGCKTSFLHAGAKSSVPEMRSAEAMKFKFWGGDVTASERPWNTEGDDFPRPTDGNRRSHGKSLGVGDPNGRRKASEPCEQTALGLRSKDAHSNRAETPQPDSKGPLIKSQQPLPDKRHWGADLSQTRPGRAESPKPLDSAAAALKRGAPKRSADGQRWLVLPHVFVLVTVPSPATGRPFIYTLREEKGFYDPGYGMGPRSPAFVDHLMAFEDEQDAARYARLVDASAPHGDSAVSLWVEQVFFVQKGTEITPPADNAEGSVTSSTRRPWNPVDRLVFDQTLLQANGVEHWDGAMDYEEERKRLESLIRRPHDR